MPTTVGQQKDRWDYIKALGINDFSRAVGIGRSTTYTLINAGKIRSVMIGGRRVIPTSEVDRLLNPDRAAS